MRLVLTRNWIINVGTYNLDFAKQNDARLVVYSADTHDTGSNRYSGVIQFINVKVIFLNETREFSFRSRYNYSHSSYPPTSIHTSQYCNCRPMSPLSRLHAFDFKDLKDGLQCPITVSQDVTFYQTKVDKFLEIFKEFVENNPPYEVQDEVMCGAVESV